MKNDSRKSQTFHHNQLCFPIILSESQTCSFSFKHPASTYKFLVVVYIMSVIHVMGNFTRNGVDILSVGFGGWPMWHHNLSSIIIFTTFSKIITRMLIRWCGGRRADSRKSPDIPRRLTSAA